MIIVDSHHKVLPGWAEYRKTLAQPPRLITLDYHTDTSKPFRRFLKKTYGDSLENDSRARGLLGSMDFKSPDSMNNAVKHLNNDEHIMAAIMSGIISSAFVVAHSARDTDLATYGEFKVMCRAIDPDPQSRKVERFLCDQVLESAFLKDKIESLNKDLMQLGEVALFDAPYILDIDLDYFNTLKSVQPENADMFRSMVQRAGLISVATEPDYVNHCSLDQGLTSDILLSNLMTLIQSTERESI
jgi:hypothetical protein